MIPIQCGEADHTLLALYDPPGSSPARSGIVVCYPWAAEYLPAYRIVRFLAQRLSAAGHHVLRFDYYGCGDSGGDFTDGGVDCWVADAGTAVAELKAVSGVARVTLIGVRGGALIASGLATRRSDVDRIVLWDPVLDPAGSLERAMERSRATQADFPEGWPEADGTVELSGYLYTGAMGRSIRDSAIDVDGWRSVRAVTVVATDEPPEAYATLAERARDRDLPVEIVSRPARAPWSGQDEYLVGAVPVEVVDAIVEALA